MNKTTKPKFLFAFALSEANPKVVYIKRSYHSFGYDTKTVEGQFFRVIPEGSREVFLLQMLEMHREKYAPAQGNGILVSHAAFKKLTA